MTTPTPVPPDIKLADIEHGDTQPDLTPTPPPEPVGDVTYAYDENDIADTCNRVWRAIRDLGPCDIRACVDDLTRAITPHPVITAEWTDGPAYPFES